MFEMIFSAIPSGVATRVTAQTAIRSDVGPYCLTREVCRKVFKLVSYIHIWWGNKVE